MGKNTNKKYNKLLMQVLSVVIAISLWVIVGYTEDPNIDVMINDVQIEYKGISKLESNNLTVNQAEKVPALSVKIRGKRSQIFQVLGNVQASVDVSNLTGEGTYTLDIKVDLPVNTVQIIKQKTTTLDILVEPVTTKEVPVVVRQMGQDKNKEKLVRSTTDNQVIEVTCAKSLCEKISKAEILVDIGDINADNRKKYKYRLLDTAGNDLDVGRFVKTKTTDIVVTNKVYTPKTVSVTSRIPDIVNAQYAVNVKSVTPTSVLVGVRNGVEINEVTAMFPDTGYEAGVKDYSLTLTEPTDVYIPEDEQTVKVRAEVFNKVTKSVTTEIQVKNAPDGTTPVLDKQMIDVSATMPESQAVDGSLAAIIDLAGLEPGTHEVTVQFWTANHVTVQGQYKIKVII